jgi:DNA adenine methylase
VSGPFLKCAGGKTQLLPEILPRLPASIGTYYEPFLGGGAVFFALEKKKRFQQAVLSDVNEDLVTAYHLLSDPHQHFKLIEALSYLPWSEDGYYRVRSSRPTSPVKRAARFLYLNKCGFNGLHRVNAQGEFNVPFGHHKENPINGRLFSKLYAAVKALASAKKITCSDFRIVTPRVSEGDVVYCDPPYLPAVKGGFASYDASGFGVKETERLADASKLWAARGAFVLLSNADTPEVRRIFSGFELERVGARRNINSKGTGRGQVGELLIQPRGQKRTP